ncbi:MAG TPA: DUF1638 domain-containing protein [Solirubrobacteraceae bacterium]|jgi:hypothetical protein|nr:DUF1638 domain-containing protein [Solirubrobacteraceae bacterium]
MKRVAVIACGALALDVRAIARRRGWEVDLYPVPAPLHNRPEQIPDAVAAEVARLDGDYERVAVAYGDCGTYGSLDALLAERGISRLEGENCYDVLAGDAVRDALAEQPGTYLLTDFLARTFEHTVIRELGLDRHPELLSDYFRNYTRVLWLAQRPTPDNRAAAELAAAWLRLPLEVRVVGNAGLERALERLVEPVAPVEATMPADAMVPTAPAAEPVRPKAA